MERAKRIKIVELGGDDLVRKVSGKFVAAITVIDPDTSKEVEIEIWKMENGGMIGIDSMAFRGQGGGPIWSAFDRNTTVKE